LKKAAGPIEIKQGELGRVEQRIKLDYLNSIRPMGSRPEIAPTYK